jgi:heme-degrading monooxygenase HmoA
MIACKRFQQSSRGDACVPRAYIVQNRFKVLPGYKDTFELAWMKRKSYLHEMPGYISFSLLRNEDQGKNEYISHTVWQDKASFDNWLASPQFEKSHASSKRAGFMGVLQERPVFDCYDTLITASVPEALTDV